MISVAVKTTPRAFKDRSIGLIGVLVRIGKGVTIKAFDWLTGLLLIYGPLSQEALRTAVKASVVIQRIWKVLETGSRAGK